MKYQYNGTDLIDERQDYMYSKFEGEDFIDAYLENRLTFLNSSLLQAVSVETIESKVVTELEKFLELDRESKLENDVGLLCTKCFLLNIAKSFLLGDKEKAICNLDLLVHRFEVSKKIYPFYESTVKSGSGSDREYILYLLLGLVLAYSYIKTGDLQHLSTLLKIVDIIISIKPRIKLEHAEFGIFEVLVLSEVNLVERLNVNTC
tara:strand:+ start:152 stop:766 length:615 start_codon:yes stop_codon:yes gene_type:complete